MAGKQALVAGERVSGHALAVVQQGLGGRSRVEAGGVRGLDGLRALAKQEVVVGRVAEGVEGLPRSLRIAAYAEQALKGVSGPDAALDRRVQVGLGVGIDTLGEGQIGVGGVLGRLAGVPRRIAADKGATNGGGSSRGGGGHAKGSLGE